VARETGADVLYVDQYGISGDDKRCYAPHHGHPVPSNPILEEKRLLEELRAGLDEVSPHTGIYIEFTPCDALMGRIDAAFDYGMTIRNLPLHATRLPLRRYAFPQVRFVEMVGFGIRPVPVLADDLHCSFFHGMSLWLKGRSGAWFSTGFREAARQMHAVLTEHAEAFHADRCEPLIPTRVPGLYANLFEGPSERIITVYNATLSTIRGELLNIDAGVSGVTVQDLFAECAAKTARDGARVTITGSVEPWSAGAFSIRPAEWGRPD